MERLFALKDESCTPGCVVSVCTWDVVTCHCHMCTSHITADPRVAKCGAAVQYAARSVEVWNRTTLGYSVHGGFANSPALE